MPIGLGRATRKLTHVGLTLAPERWRGRWLVLPLLLAAALAAGAALGYVFAERSVPVAAPRPLVAAPELAVLRQQLEQARMALRVADARSQELERQIDALNQKLTESQDQLTFFKKAREGKR
jgi:septal ring factor EnvC (AmiA/AmiB activator)